MGAIKTYLEEATGLVHNHQSWSIESLTNQFCKDMKCDRGTAVYFIEKAIENDTALNTSFEYLYDFDGECDDGI